MKRYFDFVKQGATAEITIYGEITSWEWFESDISSYTLSRQLAALGDDVTDINVYINSYGGEVAEGLAIYNALKRHKAKVHTYCDGFACSIASVIFMAGDERIINPASLLMIHNAWTYSEGNADELRKAADNLDVITSASKAAYLEKISISGEELTALMDAETWITPADAVKWGFATGVSSEAQTTKAAQSAKRAVFEKLTGSETPKTPEKEPKQKEPKHKENTLHDILSVWGNFMSKNGGMFND